MNREQICIFVCGVLILFILAVLILAVLRRIRSKRKVRSMGMSEKIRKLNELAEPFGFQYLWEEDIFTSNIDAWQRKSGYETLYDRAAINANMVIDAWPVYFDYDGRTWLIEFWIGQYGINTGGEVGVYHAKNIVPPHLYKTAHYDAVKSMEMPHICCRLERKGAKVYEIYARHWWLTGFRMGTFSKPSELRMMTTLSVLLPVRLPRPAHLLSAQQATVYTSAALPCYNFRFPLPPQISAPTLREAQDSTPPGLRLPPQDDGTPLKTHTTRPFSVFPPPRT